MTARRRQKVYEFVCAFVDEHGCMPTCYEIGAEFKISHVGAWKHINELVADGMLVRARKGRYGKVTIAGRVDLRPVPTEKLQAELARRRAVRHAEASQ